MDDITITPSQLSTALELLFSLRRRALIKGPPGIGKTAIVSQVCTRLGYELVTLYPSVSDPTDFKGLPFVVDGKGVFVPFGDLDRVLSATEPTVLFLDDLGQATEAVQAAVMQLVDRCRDNSNVMIAAATNERHHRAGVVGLLEPVKSRFDSILSLRADWEDWKTWAFASGIDHRVIAHLAQCPQDLCSWEPHADIANQPLPRTWEAASAILSRASTPDDLLLALLAGAIGQAKATSFVAWLRIANDAPSRDEVLADPAKARIPRSPDAIYAICAALAHRPKAGEFPAVATYLQRLHAAGHGECCAFALQAIFRALPTIKSTAAFSALARSPLGSLVIEASQVPVRSAK